MGNFQEKASFIWDLADLLSESYKRNEYQKVILPFTVLKRFDAILQYCKWDILKNYNEYKDKLDDLSPVLNNVASMKTVTN